MHRRLATLGAAALLVPTASLPAPSSAASAAFVPPPSALAALAAPAAQAGSSVLEPGQTSAPLSATGCSAVTEGPGSDPSCSVCFPTDCDGLADNEAHASVITPGFPLGLGRRVATSTLRTGFSVSSTPQTLGNVLDSTINYDVEWRGFWFILAALNLFDSVQEMTIQIDLLDVTQGQFVKHQLVRQTEVGTLGFEDIFEGATKIDAGSQSGVIDIPLKRGHTYEIHFVLRVESSANLGAVVDIDYGSGDKGARWTKLTVTAGVDEQQRADELHRITVEQQLKQGTALACLYLPTEHGGQLDSVLALVDRIIADSTQAGLELRNAPYWMNLAHAARAAGDYRAAYARACTAYRLLTN